MIIEAPTRPVAPPVIAGAADIGLGMMGGPFVRRTGKAMLLMIIGVLSSEFYEPP